MELKTFAVTGVDHGSIVECEDEQEAIWIFKGHYNDEEVLSVKDLAGSSLSNL